MSDNAHLPTDTSEVRQALGLVLDLAVDAVVVINELGQVTLWNVHAQDMFGWQSEEALGQPLADLIVPESLRASHAAGFSEYLSTGRKRLIGRRTEIQGQHKSGRLVDVEVVISEFFVAERRYFVGVLRDVTSERRRWERLHFVNERYDALFENAGNAVIVHHADGRIIQANATAISWFQSADESTPLASVWHCFASDAQEQARDFYLNLDDDAADTWVTRTTIGGHRVVDLEVRASAALFEGRPIFQSVLHDVTHALNEERRLRNRLEELDTLLELSPAGLALVDSNGRVRTCNIQFAKLMQRSRGELVGTTVGELDTWITQQIGVDAAPRPIISVASNSDSTSPTIFHTRGDPVRTFRVDVRSLPGGEREASSIVLLTDLTQETELDRLKTRFLSAVAHELRTPLGIIEGYADLLDDLEESMDILPEAIEAIRDESARVLGLVDELLDISRLGALGVRDLTPREFDLGDWARQVVSRLAQNTRRANINLSLELASPSVFADRDKMSRALTNLISNACKYSSDDRDVDVHISDLGTEVQIQVRDRGPGLSPEDIARLGEPFFRANATKAKKGTGLGLSLVKEVANAHEGMLSFRSVIGQGLTATLTIPRDSSLASQRQ